MMTQPTLPRQAAAIVLAIFLGSITSARAALTNGDFEAGGASWTVTSGTVQFSIDEGAAPGDGVATLIESDLYDNGVSLSSFQQTFTLQPGDTTLSFDYLLTVVGGGAPPETDHFRVELGGNEYDVASTSGFTSSNDSLQGPWSLDVSGWPRGDVTLAFCLVGQDDDYITMVDIDNVTCTGAAIPVPAPGAAVLAALGLSCIACRRSRRCQVS